MPPTASAPDFVSLTTVRIARASLHRYDLPLRAEWRSAAGRLTQRSGWLLRLVTDEGRCGYGECAPLPSHGTELESGALQALQQWQTRLPGQAAADALEALATLESFATPAARSAVETALLDLLAQAADRSLLHCLRQCRCSDAIAVNAMLGDACKVTTDAVDAALNGGHTVLKLKLGIATPDEELAALRVLAARLPKGVELRLDANRAWDRGTAERVLGKLAGLPVDAVEEPLATPDAKALAELQQRVPFALALDESLRGFDPDALFGEAPVRRLVLKLAPLGGLLPALTLAQRAAAAGMECVVSTGIDSACGTLAAAQLAAVLGNPLAHGLDTSRWLMRDTGTPPVFCKGMLHLPHAAGLGFQPNAGLAFD